MSTDRKVLAVCVNWNGQQVLAETLSALSQSHYRSLEIVVVDNASTDGSLALVPPSIRVLALDQNRGYAAALNAAIRESQKSVGIGGDEAPEYYYLLNNDIVVDPDALCQLVQFAEERGAGIYGPKILRHEDRSRLDAAWGHLNWSHVLCSYQGKGASDGPRWNHVKPVDLLLGCALLVHRQIFEKVGLFDESFFMYHEEVDFLYRAARMSYPIYYCPFAQALHRGAHSTRQRPQQKTFWIRRNTVLFFKKHEVGTWRWVFFWSTLVASLLYNILLFRWRRVRTILEGVREGLFPGMKP